MSVHDKVIQNSKAAAINLMTEMFDKMEFDPIQLKGDETISRLSLSHIKVDPNKYEIRIHDDRLLVHCHEFEAQITGHSRKIKHGLFHEVIGEENFDFMGLIQTGGLQMDLEFVMDH